MLKTKIIAADLKNLTDARYFAAWLVDYMSYDLSDPTVDLTSIKEMMDWVEGPISVARYTGLEVLSDIEIQLTALSVDHIIIGPFANDEIRQSDWQIIQTIVLNENHGNLTSDRSYILRSLIAFSDLDDNAKASIRELSSSHTIFFDCDFSPYDLEEILTLGVEGLVLRGGEEEKVGVKTYEDLDAIFEALED